jgi:hypothetical protein
MITGKSKGKTLTSFSFVSSFIALLIGLLIIATHSIAYNPADVYMSLILELLILIIMTFLLNLFIPIVKNIRMGILIAIPSFLELFYFYQIRPFFDYGIPNRSYYIITVACIFGPLFESIELICIVVFSRLGTIINNRIHVEHVI